VNFFKVHQHLLDRPVSDVEAEVFRQLDAMSAPPPRGEIAITAGSRGVANIAAITRAAGEWIKAQGATPFVVPAMGSHNGATAEGQRAMIESLGITEDAMGMEIRASMDVVEVGEVSSGTVYMDRHCSESDGVLVLNRIKLHTCFAGPVQSGLTKMMVVGMGKINSARTFHDAPRSTMKDILLEMGRVLVDSGRIYAGLGIIEDGFDQTAELHAIPGAEILDREPELLKRHEAYFPRLPVDDLSCLVVDEIGKTHSGTGMDTNVIGYRGVRENEDLDRPRIRVIAALGLNAASQGNAIGIGLADVITQRLRDAMDERKTMINVFTTGDLARGKIPPTFATDEALFKALSERFGFERWMVVPNTLHLETLYVSEDLVKEVSDAGCTVDPDPVPLSFVDGRHQLSF